MADDLFFKTTFEAGRGTMTWLGPATVPWTNLNELGQLGLYAAYIQFLNLTLDLGVAHALAHGYTAEQLGAVPGLAENLARVLHRNMSPEDVEALRKQMDVTRVKLEGLAADPRVPANP